MQIRADILGTPHRRAVFLVRIYGSEECACFCSSFLNRYFDCEFEFGTPICINERIQSAVVVAMATPRLLI